MKEGKKYVCPKCGGSGWVEKLGFMLGVKWFVPSVVCSECKGKGVIKK